MILCHPEWAYLRLDLSAEVRRGVEEKVSNEVATNVLMPWADGALHARDVHPADVMAGLFATTRASRSAVLQRLKAPFVAGSRRACATRGVRNLHDMKAEGVLDHDGRYVFVALTPEARFGTVESNIRPTSARTPPAAERLRLIGQGHL